jgi:signal peptidase II
VSAGRRRSYLLAALVVLLDQVTKAWAVQVLPPGLPRPLLPGLLELLLTWNTGAAFSLFTGHTEVLGVVSLVVALGVAVWIGRQRSLSLVRSLALGFLLGGAVGNGIDRWRLGAVVDFLSFVPISFPVFNLADVAINLAVLCFVIDLFGDHGPRRA